MCSFSQMINKRKLAIFLLLLDKKKRNRKIWAKDWLDVKFNPVEIFSHWEDDIKSYLRMDDRLFQELFFAIEADIRKEDTIMRTSVPAEKRLLIALRYLATGESFASLHFQFQIGATTVSEIVLEVVEAIIKVFSYQIPVSIF